MEQYESKLIRELEIIIGLHVTKLGKVIAELNSIGKKKWYDTLKEEVNEACSLLVEEATLFVAVHHYRKTCTRLCKILQISMLPYDCEELTLYEEKKLLESRMKEYEDEISLRQDRLEAMNLKQVELCKLLEKVPMTFIEKTIPSETELENLSNEVEKLEGEYEKLAEDFQETHLKIVTALTELNLQMREDILNIITSLENQTQPLSMELLRILQEYYCELQTLQKQEEQKQLDSLKATFDELYEACHIMESDRTFIKNIYNHSLDEIQTEINTLKTRLQENGELFALLAKYQNSWKKLAKDVEEFHKTSDVDTSVEPILSLCTEIGDIEAKLIDSTIEFEKRKKESFTTFGKTIPEIIAGLHDVYGKYYVNDGSANRTLSDLITNSNETIVTEKVTEDLNKKINAKPKGNTKKRSRETAKEESAQKPTTKTPKDDTGRSTNQCDTQNSCLPPEEQQQTSLLMKILEGSMDVIQPQNNSSSAPNILDPTIDVIQPLNNSSSTPSILKTRIDVIQSQNDGSSTPISPSPTVRTIPSEKKLNDATNPKSVKLNDVINNLVDIEHLLDVQKSTSDALKQSAKEHDYSKLNTAADDTADHTGEITLKSLLTTQQYIKDKKNLVNSAIPSYQEAFEDALVTNAEYKCQHCTRMFKARRFLAVHEKVHIRNPYSCDLCDKRFRTESDLSQHLSSHKNTIATEIKIVDEPEDVTEPVESMMVEDLENLVFSFESPLLVTSNTDIPDIAFEEIRTSFSTGDKETNENTTHIIQYENLPSSSNTYSESNSKFNNISAVNSGGFIEKKWKPNIIKCKKKHRFVPRWKDKFQLSAQSSTTPIGTKKAKVDVIQNLFKELDLK